jgi:hypothetical protein
MEIKDINASRFALADILESIEYFHKRLSIDVYTQFPLTATMTEIFGINKYQSVS